MMYVTSASGYYLAYEFSFSFWGLEWMEQQNIKYKLLPTRRFFAVLFFFGCFRLSFLVAVRVAILISTFHWSFRYDGMISFGPAEINLPAIKTPKYFNGFICSRRMTNFRLSFIGSQKPLTINVAVYMECSNIFFSTGCVRIHVFWLGHFGWTVLI